MKITQGKLRHIIVRDIKYQQEGGIHSSLKNLKKTLLIASHFSVPPYFTKPSSCSRGVVVIPPR